MKARYHEIPEELRALPNWLVWRLEKRADRFGVMHDTKVPYNARSHQHGKSNDPATWSTFSEAKAALARGYNGLGFSMTPPYVGVDLDGCRQDGTDETWASDVIRELNSYSELSPSSRGVHVIVKGELPEGRRQKDFKDRDHHGIGLYDAVRGRYFTMTGCHINGTVIAERTTELRRIHARLFPPKTGKSKLDANGSADDDLIARARNANDGGKFARLWDGQWQGDYPSQSEADLALCMKLAFWTDRNAGRVDALFRRSGLVREKWNRDDYREMTIGKAIEQTTTTWHPRGGGEQSLTASIDTDRVTPTMELLNACSIFDGRIHFTAVKRRGPMIVAEFSDGGEAIWRSMTDLTSFARSQAILAEATQLLLPTPPLRKIKQLWEPAAQWILRLAGNDRISSAESLRDEFRHIIHTTWKRAGCPDTAADMNREEDTLFFEFLRDCLEHRRDPASFKPPRHCVWHDEKHCYVHQPSLIEWLSTPAARNKHYDWTEVRNALLLLDFRPEQIHRSIANQTVKVRLWQGPLDLLIDDEAGE